MRNCTRCNGEGTTIRKGFYEGKHVKGGKYVCRSCKGARQFAPPHEEIIREIIVSCLTRKLRSVFPSGDYNRFTDINAARAYYVWRLARWNGGVDKSIPAFADIALQGEPFRYELNAIGEKLAREFFGTDLEGNIVFAEVI